jgi:hypothetical protein
VSDHLGGVGLAFTSEAAWNVMRGDSGGTLGSTTASMTTGRLAFSA